MKIWTPAEDDHLLAMDHMPAGRVARRFNCTVDEVRQRVEQLRRSGPGHDQLAGTASEQTPAAQAKTAASNGKEPDPVQQRLPKGVTQEMIQDALSPLQRDFIEASAHYKALGMKLQDLSHTVGASLAEVELAELIAQVLKTPRAIGEQVHEKIARKLLERHIVLPKPAAQ